MIRLTESMKRTIANIKLMSDIATKITPYTNETDDITELISLMHYDTKIESVIAWITAYDTCTNDLATDNTMSIPTDTVPDNTVTTTEQLVIEQSTEPIVTVPQEPTEPVADDDSTNEPPVEFDKEFIHYATYPDLDTTIANKVIEHYDKQKWLKLDKNAEWIRNEQLPIMVSDSGLFFDLVENKPIVPYWHAGELFIDIVVNDERVQKRCGAMIATVFQLKRPPVIQNDTNVIDFKDNDRRNLRLDNLCYSRKSLKPSNTTLLLNDVCQRCIEYKFNASKVASLYNGDDEIEITVDFVKDLIAKKQRTDISDNYWKLDAHKKPVPVIPKLPSTSFVDVAAVFLQGDTIENCEILIDSKIAGNYALSDAEKELLCNLAKKALPNTGITYSNIAVYIVNNYKWEISANEVKRLMNHPTAITQKFVEITTTNTESEAV